MIKVGERLVLSLWDEAGFEAEVGPIRRGDGLVPLTLAHNVATRSEVDAVLATARAAGADPVGEAEERDWGGYTGYFADPLPLGDRLESQPHRPGRAALNPFAGPSPMPGG